MRSIKLFLVVAANFLVFGVGLHVISTYLYLKGAIPEYCRGTVLRCIRDLFRQHWADDSWGPMMAALKNFTMSPQVSIYQSSFFERTHGFRFMYPLPTLLPLWMLQRIGFTESATHSALDILSWLAVFATAACAVAVALRTADTLKVANQSRWLLVATTLLASLTFYPVMWAYQIGQIQTFVNLLFCVAFYCWLTKRERAAGLLTGILVLMKPQFLLLVAWGFLRRRWSFAWAGVFSLALGFLVSILVFGVANHFDYLRALTFLTRHGESHYANQSFNGLLNRLFLSQRSVELVTDSYPPEQPLIYVATTITSALLVLWAVAWRVQASEQARMMDFSVVAIAATAASPLAWYHHYGILLPVLIWLFVQFPENRRWGWRVYVVIVAYLLVANDPRITNLAGEHMVVNLVQSSFFFGVLLLIAFLRGQIGVGRRAGVLTAAA